MRLEPRPEQAADRTDALVLERGREARGVALELGRAPPEHVGVERGVGAGRGGARVRRELRAVGARQGLRGVESGARRVWMHEHTVTYSQQ